MDVDAEVFGRALLAASSADPGELLTVLRSDLRRQTGALDLTMYLIDYRLAALRPIEIDHPRLHRPAPVDGSQVGIAFCAEQATTERAPVGHLWHVPITVRGQRLGVLTATFADPPSPEAQQVLHSLALAAAHSLLEVSAGTDLYETSRRPGRLSLAAEMQWQLLPARAFQTNDFYIAGHLEPALRVAGDAYDFAINDQSLTVAVVDAVGASGVPSWPTTLIITALRNARRSGLDLAEQVALTNDLLWQHGRGQEPITAVLLEIEARTGRAAVVAAGSPVLLRVRDHRLERQPLDSQTPLGMFEDSDYTEQAVDLRAGDRVYIVTDGAFAHERTLDDIVKLLADEQDLVNQSPPESIRRLVAELTRDGDEPEDDITTVCLDWLN